MSKLTKEAGLNKLERITSLRVEIFCDNDACIYIWLQNLPAFSRAKHELFKLGTGRQLGKEIHLYSFQTWITQVITDVAFVYHSLLVLYYQ